jgi:hypothetical protein
MHVHVSVEDITNSIGFYSALFAAPPAVVKPDYAKWMLDDPRLNFAISKRGLKPGVDHLGVQVDTEEELTALRSQVAQAEIAALEQENASCCYARSDKYWITDPQGVAWESFRSLDTVPVYGEENHSAPAACGSDQATGCCVEAAETNSDANTGGCCAGTD